MELAQQPEDAPVEPVSSNANKDLGALLTEAKPEPDKLPNLNKEDNDRYMQARQELKQIIDA